MTENQISYCIRGAIYEVYNRLGPGLLESVYVSALEWELQEQGLKVDREVSVPVVYKGVRLALGFRIDLLIEQKVLIEVKSVETLHNKHHKQVLNYLKLSGLKLGILVNFNTNDIDDEIYRKVNNL
jgi:GxxExxY protein